MENESSSTLRQYQSQGLVHETADQANFDDMIIPLEFWMLEDVPDPDCEMESSDSSSSSFATPSFLNDSLGDTKMLTMGKRKSSSVQPPSPLHPLTPRALSLRLPSPDPEVLNELHSSSDSIRSRSSSIGRDTAFSVVQPQELNSPIVKTCPLYLSHLRLYLHKILLIIRIIKILTVKRLNYQF